MKRHRLACCCCFEHLVRGEQGGLQGQRVKRADCGDGHTACVTETGLLFTWGCGAQGRLGHGNEEQVDGPRGRDCVDVELPKQVTGVKPDHWSTVHVSTMPLVTITLWADEVL